jgi:hypothetical protein
MVIGLGHFYTLPPSTDYAHPNHGLNFQTQNLVESRSPDGPDASCSVAFNFIFLIAGEVLFVSLDVLCSNRAHDRYINEVPP